jgi:hypothetical protein
MQVDGQPPIGVAKVDVGRVRRRCEAAIQLAEASVALIR